MNDSPAAWFGNKFYVELSEYKETKVFAEYDKNYSLFPLYTHPAKTLTEMEIWEELTKVKYTTISGNEVQILFKEEELYKAIRAILRKASEK